MFATLKWRWMTLESGRDAISLLMLSFMLCGARLLKPLLYWTQREQSSRKEWEGVGRRGVNQCIL